MFSGKSMATFQTVRSRLDYYSNLEESVDNEIINLLEATLTFLVQKSSATNANDENIKRMLDGIMSKVKKYSELSEKDKARYPLAPLVLCQDAIENRLEELQGMNDRIY